jgi:hypothetical protein
VDAWSPSVRYLSEQGSLTKRETLRNLIAISIAGQLILGLFAAGCGGGSDSADEQIDKATFVQQANKICEKASGKLAADVTSISQREAAKPNADFYKTQVVVVEEGLVPRLEEELQQIRRLGIPPEAKRDAENLLKVYEQKIDATKAKAKAVALDENVAPYEAIAVAGTKMGVTECPVSAVNGS